MLVMFLRKTILKSISIARARNWFVGILKVYIKKQSIKKLTIISFLVFAAAFGFGVTVKAVEVSDPCGDAGGGGNDIKKITATSDGTDIILAIELCALPLFFWYM